MWYVVVFYMDWDFCYTVVCVYNYGSAYIIASILWLDMSGAFSGTDLDIVAVIYWGTHMGNLGDKVIYV